MTVMTGSKGGPKGRMIQGVVLIIVLLVAAILAGCTSEDKEPEDEGSEEQEEQPDNPEVPDDENGNESEPSETGESEGLLVKEGSVDAVAQNDPEAVSETVEVNIPEDQLTNIDFVVSVEDGDDDEDTNPDEVSGSIYSNGGHTKTLPDGLTPYNVTINFKPPKGQFLPATWNVTMDVVCHASDDQADGPLIWRGNPDHGFSYEIIVIFKYIE